MMNTIMKKLQVLMMLVLALGLSFVMSCTEDEDPAPTQTIMGLIKDRPDLDSLQKYLEVYPDLVATLESEGNFTFFAPNNSAFISLLNTPGFPSDIRSINPGIIKNTLAYHLSTSKYLSGDFKAGVSITTASQGGEVIIINEDGKTLYTGSSNSEISITGKDIKATNGVMHTVASVLIPPTVGATLTPNLGKTSGAILLGASFSVLAQGILKAEVYAAGASKTSLLSLLAAAGSDQHTVFAPTNGTFEQGKITVDSFTGEQWYGIIATHVVLSKVVVADMTLGKTFAAASGATITVVKTDAPTDPAKGILTGIVLDADDFTNTNRAQVAVPSSASTSLVTSNGQIHIIAGLLIPPAPAAAK
jgi:uncharacterized surface protein with fasciclin (FAS1) repeats